MDYAQRKCTPASEAQQLAQGALIMAGHNWVLDGLITGSLAQELAASVPVLRDGEGPFVLYIGSFRGRTIVSVREWEELGLFWAARPTQQQQPLIDQIRAATQGTTILGQ